jgi:hypothetical protein
MPRRVVLSLLALAALGATGCGAARESERASGPAQTRQEYIARADAICRRMVADSQAEAKALKARPARALERAIALQARMIADLRALQPPPGDKQRIRAVLIHLDRLQSAIRALRTTEGEEVLIPVAAIGVETDAVARAAKRYGLFRSCGAYRENPAIRRLLREDREEPEAVGSRAGKPLTRRAPAREPEIRQLASALVPSGRSVLRRQDCAGGDRASPSCVTVELAPTDESIAARRAAIERLARRAGWTQPRPDAGEWPVGLLVLHRSDYDATVWLAGPGCTPQLQVGDGPTPSATASRCVDTIMVTAFR